MSTARGGRGREEDAEAGSRDGRNLLVEVIAQVANRLRPRIVVVENVAAFLSRAGARSSEDEPISAAVLATGLARSALRVLPVLDRLGRLRRSATPVRAVMTFIRSDEPAVAALAQSECVPYPMPTASAEDGTGHPSKMRCHNWARSHLTPRVRSLRATRRSRCTPCRCGAPIINTAWLLRFRPVLAGVLGIRRCAKPAAIPQ